MDYEDSPTRAVLGAGDAPSEAQHRGAAKGPSRSGGDANPTDTPMSHEAHELVIGLDWRIRSISPQAATWGGARPDELIGADSRQRWTVPAPLVDAIETVFASGAPSTVEFASALIPGRWVEFTVEPFEDGARISFQDVTDRVFAGLATGSGELGRPAPAAAMAIALLDPRGVIASVNEAWRAASAAHGVRRANAGVGSRYVDLCKDVVEDLDEAALQRELDKLLTGESAAFQATYDVEAPHGRQRRAVQITPLPVGGLTFYVAIHEDLTEQARIEANLRQRSHQLRLAQEKERSEPLLDAPLDERELAALERFTARQLEVTRLVAEGNSSKTIAWRLGISTRTVEQHRAAALRKAGVRTAAEFVRFAIRHNLIRA